MTEANDDTGLEELSAIADILMGAAHADGDVDGSEAEEIEQILADLIGADSIPEELHDHLGAFDNASFDLEAVCKQLHLASADDRKALLALIAKVTDADDVHDLGEDSYIKSVAEYIGAEEDEYADLTVDVLSISSVTPPPLPPGALDSSDKTTGEDDEEAPETDAS